MIIGIPKELKAGETRVALSPEHVKALSAKGVAFLVEREAGTASGIADAEYEAVGATLTSDRAEIFAKSEILLQVASFGTFDNEADLAALRPGQIVIGMMDPLAAPQSAATLAAKNVTAMALELVPRISRAQSMDVLSSMATLAGYKAVLTAAMAAPKIFPLLMTAAGTLQPARVFVMGAGVAGLQACATAKRLGAVVEAYDVRPDARDQIISVGAKPVQLDLDTSDAQGAGGYAKEQGEEFLRRQRELMTEVIAEQDVVITTAAVPGAKSPILVTTDMVKAMKPGSVIVDLAAERGGNCDLTQQGKTVVEYGVTIIGPENVPATVAAHASQMYGKNLETLLQLLLTDAGEVNLNFKDEIIAGITVSHGGDVPHPMMRNKLGLPPLEKPAQPAVVESSPNADGDK